MAGSLAWNRVTFERSRALAISVLPVGDLSFSGRSGVGTGIDGQHFSLRLGRAHDLDSFPPSDALQRQRHTIVHQSRQSGPGKSTNDFDHSEIRRPAIG